MRKVQYTWHWVDLSWQRLQHRVKTGEDIQDTYEPYRTTETQAQESKLVEEAKNPDSGRSDEVEGAEDGANARHLLSMMPEEKTLKTLQALQTTLTLGSQVLARLISPTSFVSIVGTDLRIIKGEYLTT